MNNFDHIDFAVSGKFVLNFFFSSQRHDHFLSSTDLGLS